MSVVFCSGISKGKKCTNWPKNDGRCSAHSKQYEKKLKGENGAKKPVMVEVVSKVIKNDKERYYGGAANQPHVHVYPGGAHLKLGKHRYNLVQKRVTYDNAIEDAKEALNDHAMGGTLRPWVDAAIAYFS